MSDQHEYIIQVADRETGKLSQLKLRSSDPDTARATAYEKGWIVESIRLASPADDQPKPPRTPTPKPAKVSTPENSRAKWARKVTRAPVWLRLLGLGHMLLAVPLAVISTRDSEVMIAFGLWITGAIFFAAGSCARYIIAAIVGPHRT